jgi:mono/diheme cytochrome c family protein/peroxiredoxin
MSEDRPSVRNLKAGLKVAALGGLTLALSAALAGTVRSHLDWRQTASVAGRSTEARGDRGTLLYQVHCAHCHGPEGHGDGPDAAMVQPPPRDFAAARGEGTLVSESVQRAIVEGVPGTSMAGWGQTFSARELEALVAHVRSFAPEGGAGGALPWSLAERLERAEFVPDARRRPAPPLLVRDVEGKTTSLDSLRGRLVLVAFWGTSCASCLEELPDLERLADRFRDASLTVLPVCLDATDATEAHAVAGRRIEHLPIYVDRDGSARLDYDVQALPWAVLIDRAGRRLGSAQGAKRWAGPEVRALVEACLTRPGSPAAP